MTAKQGEPDPRAVRDAGAALSAEAARFASFGWMRGTSGNVSLVLSRDPLRLAVTVSARDKGELTGADVVVVDAKGSAVPIDGAARPASAPAVPPAPAAPPAPSAPSAPSAEAALHAHIASVTGAGAVVHVHTVAAVAAGWHWPSGVELEGIEMLKGIGVPAEGVRVTIPVIPNSQDMRILGERFERARRPQVPAAIVASHGLYAWGSDLEQARHHTEIVEWLLELALAAV